MIMDRVLLWGARSIPVRPVRKSCYRKFCRRNRGREYHVTTNYGVSMRVALGDSVDNRIYVYGVFEPDLSEMIRNVAPQIDCFVDVGCNIGYFSSLFARMNPEAAIYSIDPNPAMVRRTRENLELNHARKCTTFNYGVSNEHGTLDFYLSPARHSKGSFLRPQKHLEQHTVLPIEVKPLMDILPAEDIRDAFLKIDAEGYDLRILSGLSASDARRFRYIFFEFVSESLPQAGVSRDNPFTIPWLGDFDMAILHSDGSLRPFVYDRTRDYSCGICLVRKGQNEAP